MTIITAVNEHVLDTDEILSLNVFVCLHARTQVYVCVSECVCVCLHLIRLLHKLAVDKFMSKC